MEKESIRIKAKLNILTSLMSRIVVIACGLVVPRIFIKTYGSAIYGITTSIAQFVAYVSLLEGGVARVARAELYTPLASGDNYEISRVYYAIKKYFGIIGLVLIAYIAVLSFAYFDIAKIQLIDRRTTFILVWVISMSLMAKYFGGLANLTLMDADQRQYISNIIITISAVLNAVIIAVLANSGKDIVTVKFFSGGVYVLQPAVYMLYIRKHYALQHVEKDISGLKNKWTGIGQHFAYFLHRNIDILMLTVFCDIKFVAVYTVYNLVVSSMSKIVRSFTSGMEAAFGNMIANQESESLKSVFHNYKYMLSTVAAILFSATAVLIVPFVRLYTTGIVDADYIQPVFAIILLLSETIDCISHPCYCLTVSANKLKESHWGSYGEAAVNIVVSMILVRWNPLVGIAMGTLTATLYKAVFYMVYSSRQIVRISLKYLIKNLLFVVVPVCGFAVVGVQIFKAGIINDYLQWAAAGFVVVAVVMMVMFILSRIMYSDELRLITHYARQTWTEKRK